MPEQQTLSFQVDELNGKRGREVVHGDVLAANHGGLPEIVPEPWLVAVGDADALAATVVQALAHPSPFPLPPQFTAAAMAHGVLAVYRSLV